MKNKRANSNNDRDEIRRKLASTISSSSSSSSFADNGNQETSVISDYLRANSTSRSKTHYLGQNLQICFMNDAIKDDENEEEDDDVDDGDFGHGEDVESIPASESGEHFEAGEEVKRSSSATISNGAKPNAMKHTSMPISLSNFAIDFNCANESWNTILAQLQVKNKLLDKLNLK
jgi:hypothetical protein